MLFLSQDRISSEDERGSRSKSIRMLDAREPQGGDHLGAPVRASYYHVRMHLRLSVPEGDVADERKQFHLFVENAGWVIIFCLPVEPTQLRVRKSADGREAASRQTLCPREVLQHARDLVAGLKDQGKTLWVIL